MAKTPKQTTDSSSDRAPSFERPHEVSDIDVAFPASVRHLMPEYWSIPDEFKSSAHPWCRWQQDWFFNGLSAFPEPRDGIDQTAAFRHLKCIQGSFEPKHQHKEAAVAYLASLWFVEPKKGAA